MDNPALNAIHLFVFFLQKPSDQRLNFSPIGLLEDDSFIKLITSLMGAKDLESDPHQVRLLLLHSKLAVDGCYKDAPGVIMTYPIYSFSGKLYEMKHLGSFTNNGTVFQHRVVNNWVVRRTLSNNSYEYYGVDRADCSFIFESVQCTNLHKICIPTNISECEIAFFRTTDKLFTLVRPFNDKFLVATTAKRYLRKSENNSLTEPVPSPVFVLSVPTGMIIHIGSQRIEGINSETFEFDHDQAVREHANDELVNELEREIKKYTDVNYDHENDRPTAYHVMFWIVLLTDWILTMSLHSLLFVFGSSFLARWRGNHRSPHYNESFAVTPLVPSCLTIDSVDERVEGDRLSIY